MVYLQNFKRAGNDYFAEMLNSRNNTTISVIIQKGGGNCDWVAFNRDNNDLIEIISVGNNKDISEWQDGDIVELGTIIKPNIVK